MMDVSGKRTDDVSELCDVCQSDPANGFCDDCKEYMCQGCFHDHKKAKPCRRHVLAPIDQAVILMTQKTHEEKCKIHTTENIRYYCRKHNVVGCGDCIVYHHGGCKAEAIKDLAIKFEDCVEFKEMLSRIQKCSTDNKENTKRLENDIKQNKAMIDKALDEIRKFRKEMNDFFDKAETNIIDQANKHSKKNETTFSQLRQKIDEVAKEIDELRKKLDTREHQGEDLFIRMVECKSKETNIQQTITEIKTRNMIKTYTFQPDQKLKDMLTSNVCFGTIQFRDDNGANKTTCETNVDKLVLKSEESSATKQTTAENKYSPPDPRSAGFDVGKRVKFVGKVYSPDVRYRGTGTGTIVSVDPTGLVDVCWDQGGTLRENAEALGCYYVRLL